MGVICDGLGSRVVIGPYVWHLCVQSVARPVQSGQSFGDADQIVKAASTM